MHLFRLRQKPLQEAAAWIDRHQRFWNGAIDQLEALLNKGTP
jgi:hypothetical protein